MRGRRAKYQNEPETVWHERLPAAKGAAAMPKPVRFKEMKRLHDEGPMPEMKRRPFKRKNFHA